MILYRLNCKHGHEFESWFPGSDAFVTQKERGLVTCAVCGSTDVERALMSPSVASKKATAPSLSPQTEKETAIAEMRRKIEANSDYVGRDFANEARRIHLGEADARGIWGEASRDEAKALKDEGIPVAPLPFLRRTDG